MENHLINVLGLKIKNLTQKELTLIEIYIYNYIFKDLYSCFNYELKNSDIKEHGMFDGLVIKKLANDLILNQDYSISGLAQYAGFPEEVIYELVAGINCNPTITLANKIIELHVSARREIYISFLRDAIKSGDLNFF